MIVECGQCHAKYNYDDARFGGKSSKKLRCAKCRAIFEVSRIASVEARPEPRVPRAPDETAIRRPGDRPAATSPLPADHDRTPTRPPAVGLKLPPNQKLSLAVIAGPDAGRMFLIEKPRIVIGRDEVDLVLDDPEVSRQHAAIEVAGENVTVVDLGSANGTVVGVGPVSDAPLENQSEFSVGGSTLMLIVTPFP